MTQLELPFETENLSLDVKWTYLNYLGVFEITVTLLVDGDFPVLYARYEGSKKKGIVGRMQSELFTAYRARYVRPYGDEWNSPDFYICYLID